MSGPLRPCGRVECRLCHPRPEEREGDELASAFIGMAAIVLLFFVIFFLLPGPM